MIFSTKLDAESTIIPVACKKKQKNLGDKDPKSTCRKLFTHSTISDHEIKVSIFLLDLILVPKKLKGW